jgi:hypothetical protein
VFIEYPQVTGLSFHYSSTPVIKILQGTGSNNEITISNGATPAISTTGVDTNINLNINAKGTGYINMTRVNVYAQDTASANFTFRSISSTNADVFIIRNDGEVLFNNGHIKSGLDTFDITSFAGYNLLHIDRFNSNLYINYDSLTLPTGINNTFVGFKAGQNATTASQNVFLGRTTGSGIVTGQYNAFLGYSVSSTTDVSHSIGIGSNARITGSNQLVIGSHSSPISEIVVGSGWNRDGSTTFAGESVRLRASGAFGSNQIGGNLTIASGQSTGAAAVTKLYFQTPSINSSGSTLQTLVNRLEIDSSTIVINNVGHTVINSTNGKGAIYGADYSATYEDLSLVHKAWVVSQNTVLSNSLFVDPNGNDTTGSKGKIGAPFQTIQVALSNAVSGDTIFVFPGEYTITASILKNGVTYYFSPGAKVTISNGNSPFTDNGITTICKIKGYGEFYQNSVSGKMGNLSGTNSVFDLECLVLVDNRNQGFGANRGCFRGSGSVKLIVRNANFQTPLACGFLFETGSILELHNVTVKADYDRVAEIRTGSFGYFYNCKLKETDTVSATPLLDLGSSVIPGGTNTLELHNCILQSEGNGLVLYSLSDQIIKMIGTNIFITGSNNYSIQIGSGNVDFKIYGTLITNKIESPSGTLTPQIGEYIVDANVINII